MLRVEVLLHALHVQAMLVLARPRGYLLPLLHRLKAQRAVRPQVLLVQLIVGIELDGTGNDGLSVCRIGSKALSKHPLRPLHLDSLEQVSLDLPSDLQSSDVLRVFLLPLMNPLDAFANVIIEAQNNLPILLV